MTCKMRLCWIVFLYTLRASHEMKAIILGWHVRSIFSKNITYTRLDSLSTFSGRKFTINNLKHDKWVLILICASFFCLYFIIIVVQFTHYSSTQERKKDSSWIEMKKNTKFARSFSTNFQRVSSSLFFYSTADIIIVVFVLFQFFPPFFQHFQRVFEKRVFK